VQRHKTSRGKEEEEVEEVRMTKKNPPKYF
jgi:hypothetical protein